MKGDMDTTQFIIRTYTHILMMFRYPVVGVRVHTCICMYVCVVMIARVLCVCVCV